MYNDLSYEELLAEQVRLNELKAEIKVQLRQVQKELDQKLLLKQAEEKLSKLTPSEREAMAVLLNDSQKS